MSVQVQVLLARMDYTRDVGKMRFENSPAKTLIYQMDEYSPDRGQRALLLRLAHTKRSTVSKLPRHRCVATAVDNMPVSCSGQTVQAAHPICDVRGL
jgi:hypothetical protein